MIKMGPGDYLVVAPTLMLMQKKVLPIFQRFFESLMKLGHFVGCKNIFHFSEQGCNNLWGHVPDNPPRRLIRPRRRPRKPGVGDNQGGVAG